MEKSLFNIKKIKLKDKIKHFKGKEIVIISDFDGTLTQRYSRNKKFINSISVFRNTDFLSKHYRTESEKIFYK